MSERRCARNRPLRPLLAPARPLRRMGLPHETGFQALLDVGLWILAQRSAIQGQVLVEGQFYSSRLRRAAPVRLLTGRSHRPFRGHRSGRPELGRPPENKKSEFD